QIRVTQIRNARFLHRQTRSAWASSGELPGEPSTSVPGKRENPIPQSPAEVYQRDPEIGCLESSPRVSLLTASFDLTLGANLRDEPIVTAFDLEWLRTPAKQVIPPAPPACFE